VNVVVSPHLDDAVLSLGQYLSAEPCRVVTIFAGRPDDFAVTEYDRARGYDSSFKAMCDRRAEDIAALTSLNCEWLHLDYLDQQYVRADSTIREQQVTREIRAQKDRQSHLLVPLGLGHPDHRLVSMAAEAAVRSLSAELRELWLYEELPYRVLWPEQAHQRLQGMRWSGWTIDELPVPIAQGDRAMKERAIAEYRSQYPAGADDPCVLVPERVWRATR
jgi:LmbE family N-acetylglucosaminyl deacetylase